MTDGRGSVGEVSLGHEVVRLDRLLDVVSVDPDGDSHDHVLGALGNVAVDSEQVRSLERLEPEAEADREKQWTQVSGCMRKGIRRPAVSSTDKL